MVHKKTNLLCLDCGINTFHINDVGESEFYMVQDQVWSAAGMPPPPKDVTEDFLALWHGEETPPAKDAGDFLCIGCLEVRLGRMLTPADFTNVPVNDPTWRHRTPRLRATD